jgi:hypothetical protein
MHRRAGVKLHRGWMPDGPPREAFFCSLLMWVGGRHHIPKQRHRVTNWAAYDIALRQRGSLTVWFTEQRLRRGRPSPAPRAAASHATRRWRSRRR